MILVLLVVLSVLVVLEDHLHQSHHGLPLLLVYLYHLYLHLHQEDQQGQMDRGLPIYRNNTLNILKDK